MRRMWAAGAAIVMCLALGGAPAAAQSPSAPPAEPVTAFVSGTGSCQFVPPGTSVNIEGVRRDQAGFACSWEMSDPRVSGPGEGTWSIACWNGNEICLYWGDMTITGPDGTWAGAFQGQDASSLDTLGHGFVALQQVLEGTGAYAGWTYIAHLLFNYSTMTADGIIYEGPTMPWEPLPSLTPAA